MPAGADDHRGLRDRPRCGRSCDSGGPHHRRLRAALASAWARRRSSTPGSATGLRPTRTDSSRLIWRASPARSASSPTTWRGSRGWRTGPGREEACLAHAAEALELADALGFGSSTLFAEAALGLLELGTGQSEVAIDRLGALLRADALGVREPNRIGFRSDLIEAAVRAGRLDVAEHALADLARGVQRTRRPMSVAALHRARGLLASDDDFAAEFAAALVAHGAGRTPFERARTQLLLRRAAAAGAPARRGPHAAARGRRAVRPARCTAVGRNVRGSSCGRAERPRARTRSDVGRAADRPGAAGRADRRQRREQSRGRSRVVREPQDDRLAPAQRLPQARDPLADRAGAPRPRRGTMS